MLLCKINLKLLSAFVSSLGRHYKLSDDDDMFESSTNFDIVILVRSVAIGEK